MVTPAVIQVPLRGADTPPLRLDCEAPGYRSVHMVLEVYHDPGAAAPAVTAAAGPVGALAVCRALAE